MRFALALSLAFLILVPNASAHTLSTGRARAAVRAEMNRLKLRDQIRWCHRRNRHHVLCRAAAHIRGEAGGWTIDLGVLTFDWPVVLLRDGSVRVR